MIVKPLFKQNLIKNFAQEKNMPTIKTQTNLNEHNAHAHT